MRVSINTRDNQVFADGKMHGADCSELLSKGITAVQWDGSAGEIEFVGHAKPNENIEDFSPYQKYVDAAVPWPTSFDFHSDAGKNDGNDPAVR